MVTPAARDDSPLPRHPFDAALGDGWVEIGDGRRFWGRFGAAGLMLRDPAGRILLQHRASWSHFGDTWGLPGGARHPDETAFEGALREAGEEAGVPPALVRPVLSSVVTIGPWSYTTVVADASEAFAPEITDAESRELRWVEPDAIASLPLHPGFGSSWPQLRALADAVPTLVVDAANVVGSRPNGWWRDREGAAARLVVELSRLADQGVAADDFGLAADRLWPRIVVVLEGRARAAADAELAGVRVVSAPGSGDDAIVEVVADLSGPVLVATADRELIGRVAAHGASALGPRSLLEALDALTPSV